ncbi:DUF2357 domain-containing protein [Conexibacter sp. CPCC 205706]|uniref:DUF2357 domain-containing protein n=1 Tax=unclassified Conexibacter TaxID=2627773 RepID=UPI002717A857|nr:MULTISPECIES: DUF2357 domain-containing protein [unclassified Conexibacter]MDO8188957.1 DUF2357 domain-containing protein [Conexibacter sp. CPCC 205706]MDO8201765.1 DUF2357 domain-containing protein [Conexibacter sp. CPCC 205762]
MTREARLRLLDDQQREVGATVVLSVRPRRNDAIHDTEIDSSRLRGAPRYDLDEGAVYACEVVDLEGEIETIEPSELLYRDTATKGRLNTRGAVGQVVIEVVYREHGETKRAHAAVSVRPSKLDEDAFQAMLCEIADVAVELLHQGFAPATGGFVALPTSEPRLLYQQFALLHQQLFSRDVHRALRRILAHPHRVWKTVEEPIRPGMPLKSGGRLARQIGAGGPRRPLPDGALVPTVPRALAVERTESTYDDVPNRHVRFVLERWRALTVMTDKAIATNRLGPAPWQRGRYQVNRTLDVLDELLAHPIFREVRGQRTMPRANQVLLKQDGYRQVIAAAGIVDASLGLDLTVEDPFLISRRNVEKLYEYWCYMKLAQQLGALCGESRVRELFELRDGGMTLKLKQGRDSSLTFVRRLRGYRVEATLVNNHSFTREAVWGRDLKPDCSLRLRVRTREWGGHDDWWFHFDTKYRVEHADGTGDARSADLVKMHAYRGAIRDSVAAFVLFPGVDPCSYTLDEHQREELPAIGALPLRPDGSDSGALRLRAFLEEAFEQVLDQTSRLRRARYWTDRSYGDVRTEVTRRDPVSFLTRPAADTSILLGYVRSREQLNWIEARQRYNVRYGLRRGSLSLDSVELDARFLLLYGRGTRRRPILYRRVSIWMTVSGDELLDDSYPRPGGDAYLCCTIAPIADVPDWVGRLDVVALLGQSRAFGAPVASTWLRLLGQAS